MKLDKVMVQKQIKSMERILGVEFPVFYRNLLIEKQSVVVAGFRIFGLSGKKVSVSVAETTSVLRNRRPDLPHDFLAISFSGERALCFDLARSSGDDAPLVDVPLDKEEEILPVTDSLRAFVERHNSFEKDFERELGRLRRRKAEIERKTGKKVRRLNKKDGKRSTLHSRPKDWHPRIVRFHDNTVALAAFRYNDRHHKLEVDAFFAYDHPLYIPGDPMRGLMIILFSEALVLGGSLNLMFTREKKGKRFRVSLPKSLVRFAKERGVNFSKEKDGEIVHEEGLKLWWKLLELTPKAEERGVRLDKYGYLPKENLALILSSGIWTREETIWLLENSPRPEGILAGADTPKKRFYNMESVTYGVAALLVSRLQRKIMVELAEGFGPEEKMVAECVIEPIGKFHILKCDEEFELPWVYSKRNVKVKPEESILILSRPKVVARPSIDFNWLVSQIELVSKVETDASFRCLLLGMEYMDFPRMDELIRVAKEKDVFILLAPRRLDHYQQEVLQKMRKAGNLKRLPLREGPINLWVFSVKADCWESPALRRSTRDAETFARWINKGVDVKRAEYEFFLNCSVVEREVLQSEECASPMVKFYYESGDDFNIAEALKLWGKSYKGIMFPFLRPKEVESFLKKIPMRFLSNLRPPKGEGLVFIPEPYGAIVEDVGFEKKRKWVSLKTVIDSEVELPEPLDFKRSRASDFAYQINGCLKEGKPLPVSYLTPHLFFPEVIREYLYYREKGYSSKSSKVVVKRDSLWDEIRYMAGSPKMEKKEVTNIKTRKIPREPVYLRIVYSDGTEGQPFPLYCLRPQAGISSVRRGLFKIDLGLVSMRHPELDSIVTRYILRNREVQLRKEGSADQENLAFRKTLWLIENAMKVLEGKDLERLKSDVSFSLFADLLNLWEVKAPGFEFDIFQTTALEPVTVGVYRAIAELLLKCQGKLVIVPRVLHGFGRKGKSRTEQEESVNKEDYEELKPWF